MYNYSKYLEIPHVDQDNYLEGKTEQEIRNLFLEILSNGTHGFCFSLYEDGQKPGDIITEAQVRRRMEILKPHTQWVRSFSCTEGNEHIPKIAKEYGMKTLVGAWLCDDDEINKREIEGLISLCQQGLVDVAAVGNEVLYRKEMSEEELLNQIQDVRNQIDAKIPVGYVDAYYEFSIRPALADACDVILTNCYPFWEGCPYEHSLTHLKEMYRIAEHSGKGKRVIITETGWPSKGEDFKGAHVSQENALEYFINSQLWAIDNNIELFYFSSFDESWKVGAEGEVGAYWGIWDKHEKLKY